ncbi:hypothetical protein AAG906_039726 [Vitis piasezkii]
MNMRSENVNEDLFGLEDEDFGEEINKRMNVTNISSGDSNRERSSGKIWLFKIEKNGKMNQTNINVAYKKEARERVCMLITRKEQRKQNTHQYAKKKEEKKLKRKQVIENTSLEFFNRRMVTSTHMVSCHEISEEDESSKDEENIFGAGPSKTKEDDEVVANLQCLLLFFGIYEMLQLMRKHKLH